MLNEEWKDIKGYEGLYQVSNFGRVKSLGRIIVSKKGQEFKVEEKILKHQWRCRNRNYAFVKLYRNSDCKNASIQRLVAEAFIPNPNNLPLVNHKDENPRNNSVENLEWCTYLQNNTYGNARANQSFGLINNPKISKPVIQFDTNGSKIALYPSTMEARRQTGISHIPEVCNGKREKAGGYVWKYA